MVRVRTYFTIRSQRLRLLQSVNRILEERERKRTRWLEKSLQEKEILSRELYHRVRNNLQIQMSLVRLQCDTIKEKRIANMLKTYYN